MLFKNYTVTDYDDPVQINRKNFVNEINKTFSSYYDSDLFDALFTICMKYNSFKKEINTGKLDLVYYDTYCIYNDLDVSQDQPLANLLIRFTMFDISRKSAQERFNNINIEEIRC